MFCFEATTELMDDSADAEWQLGAYGQFLRDDSEEDAIYEPLR